MTESVSVPVKKVGNEKWADLGALALSHEICGETVHMTNGNYSFQGGHRVRLYKFKKNVHFRVPITQGSTLDISQVEEPKMPHSPARRRHKK